MLRKDINNDWLKLILEEGEGYHSEFKETLSKIDKEIVAFANASGGKIFVGISDDGQIKGFKLTNKSKSEIQSIAENCDPPIRISIDKFENIAIINVPEGNRKPYKCSSGFYLRNGATSQKMNTEDILAIFRYEGRIKFDELTESDIAKNLIIDNAKYRNFIRKCKISEEYPANDVLANLGLLVNFGNTQIMNNAGILFFAENPIRIFPQAVVTGVLYKGIEKVNILDRKDFTSDLITNVEDSMIFLKKHLNLRYKIESLQREEILEIPEEALREAIINSVVHRDYFEKGANVLIEIFDDRVEISNPGGLPKGLDKDDFGTKSVARNPLIASTMLRANYIEKLGTGINRIQNALKAEGLMPATFNMNNFFTVTFLREFNIATQKNTQITTQKSSLKTTKKSSLKSSLKIIELISINSKITIPEMASIIGISDRAIRKNINKLKKEGKIRRVGSDRAGHWEIIDN